MPYPAINTLFDELLPFGMQNYWKGSFATELTDGAIDVHLQYGPQIPTVNAAMHIYPVNGACHRVSEDATAFAYRDATFSTVIAGVWPDSADNDKNVKWVRDYYQALEPHSEAGGYVNFLDADDQDRIKDNYKGNYDRLTQIKKKYDPSNLSTTPPTSSTSTKTSYPPSHAAVHIAQNAPNRRVLHVSVTHLLSSRDLVGPL